MENMMKRILFVFLTLTLLVVGGVDGVGQTKNGKKSPVRRVFHPDSIPPELFDENGLLKEQISVLVLPDKSQPSDLTEKKETIREPTLWLIDQTPDNFGDFYNPFMETIKNLRLGNRLRIHKDWGGVWSDKNYSPNEGDFWVLLKSIEVDGKGGFLYSITMGTRDKCWNWTWWDTIEGVCSGDCKESLQIGGYEFGNIVFRYINESLGK